MKKKFILCLIVSFTGICLLLSGGNPNLGSRKFDQVVWKQGREIDENSPRLGMVDDLKANYLHAEISHEAVLKLLGKYSWKAKLNRAEHSYKYAPYSYRYVYYLGTYRLEKWFLSIAFDDENRLTTTEVFHNSE